MTKKIVMQRRFKEEQLNGDVVEGVELATMDTVTGETKYFKKPLTKKVRTPSTNPLWRGFNARTYGDDW